MEKLVVFIIALLLDLFWGEPPAVVHPVIYIGRLMKFLDVVSLGKSPLIRFMAGVLGTLIEVAVWFSVAFLIWRARGSLIGFFLSIFFLKSAFAIRSLYEHVKRCAVFDLETLRRNVSMIVSRDVSRLDKPHLYSAAIESLAENINDSITAPLFYYVLFGFPGAILYRVLNTLDAIFGYRNQKYEWFGKFSAGLDDLLNFLPARMTAVAISIFNLRRSWKYIRKYGRIKVNSTYPMSAFAGVLGLKLEKKGCYSFEGREPGLRDVEEALNLYWKVIAVIVGFSIISIYLGG